MCQDQVCHPGLCDSKTLVRPNHLSKDLRGLESSSAGKGETSLQGGRIMNPNTRLILKSDQWSRGRFERQNDLSVVCPCGCFLPLLDWQRNLVSHHLKDDISLSKYCWGPLCFVTWKSSTLGRSRPSEHTEDFPYFRLTCKQSEVLVEML